MINAVKGKVQGAVRIIAGRPNLIEEIKQT